MDVKFNEQAKWLRNFRTTNNLTHGDIGKALGIDGQNISNWERGRSPIPVKHVREILKLAGLKPGLEDCYVQEFIAACKTDLAGRLIDELYKDGENDDQRRGQ